MKVARVLIILLILAGVVITALGAIYGWWLGQLIFQNTYGAKAGVNFWETWTLEWNLFYAAILLTLLSMVSSFITFQRSTFISF
ncbi:MAG: hypothetical protein ACW960_12590, partial [Candidatus Thorarchaeota archaeon]